MDFGVLGPLQVVGGDGVVPLGGRRQRLVLAHLLLRANETVPTGTLIDDVWGDDPPAAARNSLQSYISHLRKALGGDRIGSGSGGYVLSAEPDETDARRFESLVERGRTEALTDPAAAATTFGEALALWRGPAFADLAEEQSLLGETARLEELRLSATEHLIAAQIAAGRHSVVIGELETLTDRHQLRERLWAQLMLALYRSGRQGDALAAYRRARQVLAEELGIDPSQELQDLHDRILRQDPDLRTPTGATARRGELAPGDTFAGYRIDRVLGRGGTSVVFLAEDLRLGRKVALKLLGAWLDGDPELRQRFLRESRLAASLDHPNVVPIYEAGEHDGQPFIAMRYVGGTDLRATLDVEGRLDPDRALAIVRQVAAALDAAHARGLVHRDVKPGNVLIADDGNVYLSDFGLTRRLDGDSSTGVAAFAGTLDYAAPEQFEGQPLDGRADQYSLGCVLFECLTGAPPFRRPNPASLMRAHLDEPPPAVTESRPDLAPAIDAVVRTALAKNPDDRYSSCDEMSEAATAALGVHARLGTQPSPPQPAAPVSRPPPRISPRRRRLIVGSAAAVIAAGLAIAVPRVLDGDAAASLLDLAPGMAIIDAGTGEPVAHLPDSVVKRPAEAIFADGHFWVLNLEPLSFVQIDPEAGRVVRQITSPIDDVGYFTVDGNDLWATHYTRPVLSKVDISRGREVARVEDLPGAGGSIGVIVADGSLWVARSWADDGLGILARLDPDTLEVEHLFRRLPGSVALAYGDDGAVWTGGSWGDVNRVDPRTNTVTSVDVGGRNFYVTAGGGFGWTADEAKGVVYQIDGAGEVVATHSTAIGARVVSYSDGVVWVGNQDDGSVSGIDASTGSTTTYRFSHPIQTIAAGAGRVLVQLLPGQTFEDAIAELEGDVAKLLVGGYSLEPMDPALIWSDLGRQVWFATCAGLLRHTEAGELQPEIAAAMPTVSNDERTYTFTIRSGYRFSPPSNEAVTAETFRHSIQRALSPELGPDTPGPALIDDISAIDADGDTLAITLDAPSDDFLERLAEPYVCPVPLGTPMIPGGVAVPLDGAPGEAMLPSAGPYYIDRWLNGEYTILLRNPNYTGPRPHRFDAIVLREGVDPELAGELVGSGEWDGIANMFDGDGPVEDAFSNRIGCLTPLADGAGVDLAALCRASPTDG